jgi:chromosome segregation ATPase
MESYQEADANRQVVTKLYKAFSKTVKSPGGWPPTSVESKPIHREYEAVEKDWKSIKSEQMRAIALVARLGNLSIRYQRLAVDLERETQRAMDESARIKDLEVELSALSKAWSNHRKTYHEYELAADEIRELVEGAKVEYARIKRDYREIGAQYDQASQELASLVSRLRTTQVRVDDENMLDIDGNLIPAR